MGSALDGYSRLVVWLPNTGDVCDVGPLHLLPAGTPAVEKQAFMTASGSARTSARRRPFGLAVVERTRCEHLKWMERIGCKVKMIGLGHSTHQVWLEPTYLSAEDRRGGGRGQFAGVDLSLESAVFDAPIFQSDNLLAGFPWAGTTAQPYGDDGMGGPLGYRLEHPNMPGYDGPFWIVSDEEAVVDGCGALSAGTAAATFECPLGGAVLDLTRGQGTVEALDWSGAAIAVGDLIELLELPFVAWSLRVTITQASALPRLLVIDPGPILAPRCGEFVPCSDRAEAPPWTLLVTTTSPQNIIPASIATTTDPQNILPGEPVAIETVPQNIIPASIATTTDPQNILPPA